MHEIITFSSFSHQPEGFTRENKVFVTLIPTGNDVTEADISHKMEINLPPSDTSLRQQENLIIPSAFLILTISTTLEFHVHDKIEFSFHSVII